MEIQKNLKGKIVKSDTTILRCGKKFSKIRNQTNGTWKF